MKRLLFSYFLLAVSCMAGYAQKQMYIPQEWRNRTDTLIWKESDPDNRYTWSKSRSKESDNVIVLWDKGYGSTIPTNAPSAYRVDIDDLLKKAEAFFDLEINQLGFVDPENSNLNKYKVMILLNHDTGWICYGGGYDYQVSALWLSPSTCKPVGHSVAHEIGHSFHYMCYSEASNHGADRSCQTGFHGAVGNGSVTWEQTAQWQANQSYPELMYDQSINVFRNSHNYAFTHEWHRYQSYWFFYYLCQLYGDIKTVANVWNYPETTVKDFNQVLMDYKQLSVRDLYKLYFDQACRLVTWDLDVCKPYRNNYIGDFTYRCALTADGRYQVALASCPQGTGFNVIPLQVPEAGTDITTHLTGLRPNAALADADPGEYLDGNSQYSKYGQRHYIMGGSRTDRGFRMGYVALMKDGSRRYFSEDSVYCQGASIVTEDYSMTVPEGVSQLWLVVSPALKHYTQHKWDEKIDADDMWPYQLQFEGTDIGARATVYASPTIDGRDISDVTYTYDVTFPRDTQGYSGASVSVSGQAAATLGTAFQMQNTDIASKMQNYSSSGPSNGRVMFYAVNPDGQLAKSGSTANGYGHWFDKSGKVCAYSSGYVYSEFNASSLVFTLGQYPGKCANGSKYTIRQALRYKKAAGEEAVATFVFNITIGSTVSVTLQSIDYDDPTLGIERLENSEKHIENTAIYDLSGRRVSQPTRGIYIQNGRKFVVK
ncbi:MAG: DUF4859 domain-containing protein [Prevotella sp.]|nr:DUF4859 domain-containing protein [Prevotella sp.]